MTTVGPWERERLLKNIWGKKTKTRTPHLITSYGNQTPTRSSRHQLYKSEKRVRPYITIHEI